MQKFLKDGPPKIWQQLRMTHIYIYQMNYSLNTRCTKLSLYLLSGRVYTLYNISIKITSSIRILKKAKGTYPVLIIIR